jgi:TetR/AcrR family fatty acid metabolism transcriptional regulator
MRMATSSERRTQIREAALRIFARKGYQDTVVEDVADEAGVSKGTIYTYFDRKEELLGAVYEGLFKEMEERQVRILESDRPPLDKIRALLHDFVDIVGGQEHRAQVLLDIWVAGMRDPDRFEINFAEAYAQYRALLRELLREAKAQGDVPDDLPDVAPSVLIGAIDGLLLQWLLDPDSVDFAGSADDVLEVLYRGIEGDYDDG